MQLFNDASRTLNLYTNNTEVDYRSDEVTLDSILRVLTDRHPPGTARSRRLLSDENSNVLVYITGHGGDEFMKIQVRGASCTHITVLLFHDAELRLCAPSRVRSHH